uniref:BPTI/Kunitz inhibitor domain-containing protein n=1 Tax=Oryzias latipes TaxID=8090 RepID=H2MHX0_ORYLA
MATKQSVLCHPIMISNFLWTSLTRGFWFRKRILTFLLSPLRDVGPGACSDYVLLWYFHAQSGECRPFVYGGCGGTQNRFSTRHRCQSVCGTQRRVTESDLIGGVPPRS